MINSILDNLNNLQNIKTPAVSGGENTSVSYMDNKNSSSFIKDGFDKVYEQKTNILKETASASDSQSIGELKESFNKIGGAVSDEVQSFKEILSQAANESNAESALDLTLARDINEIIAELKEAAGITSEEEDTSEDADISSDEESSDTETVEGDDTENMEVQDVEALIPAGIEQVNYTKLKDTAADSENPSEEPDINAVDENTSTSNELESNSSNNNFSSTDIDIFESETELISKETNKTQSSDGEFDNILEEDSLKELNVESIEAESGSASDDGASLMDNQSPQEQAVKAMLHSDGEIFELNAVKNNQPVQTTQTIQAKTADITPSKIIEQITKQMEGLFNNSKVNIVLNPESLGKVNIQLANSSEGLSAHFTVASNEVRDLLMKGLDGLKDTLASHGVGVDNVSVKVADTQKESDTSDWTEQEGSRGGNKGQGQPNREEKEKGLFEKTMAQTNDDFENGKV